MTSIERVQTSVTPQMASGMVALYEAGSSARDVAKAFSVHRQTAERHLRAAGVSLRKTALSAAQVEQAHTLYLAGETLAQVGERFGVSQGTVARSIRKQGAVLRPPLTRAQPLSTSSGDVSSLAE